MESHHRWEPAALIETAWNESPGIARREQAGVIAALGAALLRLARYALAR